MSYRYQFTLNNEPVEEWVNERLCATIPQEWYEVYNQCIEGLEKIFKPYNSTRCANCQTVQPKRPNCGCCYNCASYRGFTQGYAKDMGMVVGIPFDTTTGFDFQKAIDNSDDDWNYWNYDDEGWGFFDPEKHRCSVPRHLRSNTCLGYFCSRSIIVESDKMTKYVSDIMNVVRTIRRRRIDPTPNEIAIVKRVYNSNHIKKMVKENIAKKLKGC